MEIYLLRHGETIWNTEGRFQGQRDSDLTALGIEQVERVGRLLARELEGRHKTFCIHYSPLGRTSATVNLVTKHIDIEAREEARLMEVSAGSWDGLSVSDIRGHFPDALDGSNQFDWYYRSPDGERLEDACKRVQEWLSSLTSPTVAVTHGVLGRLIRGLYLGLPPKEFLELPVPQDSFYRLHERSITEVR